MTLIYIPVREFLITSVGTKPGHKIVTLILLPSSFLKVSKNEFKAAFEAQ
jgi:hypothetical protein